MKVAIAASEQEAKLLAALNGAYGEIAALKHDIERHIKIANDLATENAKLRELLIEIGMQLTSYQLNAETRRKLIQATTDK